MNNLKDVHIGSAIKHRLDESEMTYSEFARRIHCERATLYHLFKCKSIDIERLILISEVLRYDFIHELYYKSTDDEGIASRSGEPRLYIAMELPGDSIDLDSLPEEFLKLVKK